MTQLITINALLIRINWQIVFELMAVGIEPLSTLLNQTNLKEQRSNNDQREILILSPAEFFDHWIAVVSKPPNLCKANRVLKTNPF